MKKIKEPNLKVIKFESMDVIATSNETETKVRFGIQSLTTANNNDSYAF